MLPTEGYTFSFYHVLHSVTAQKAPGAALPTLADSLPAAGCSRALPSISTELLGKIVAANNEFTQVPATTSPYCNGNSAMPPDLVQTQTGAPSEGSIQR